MDFFRAKCQITLQNRNNEKKVASGSKLVGKTDLNVDSLSPACCLMYGLEHTFYGNHCL